MLVLKQKKHSLNYNKLIKFYGLGKNLSKKIISVTNESFFISSKNKDLKNITEVLNKLQKQKKLLWGLQLRREKKKTRENLELKNTLKVQRRKQGLPVHGQRTHSNGKTSKKRFFYE